MNVNYLIRNILTYALLCPLLAMGALAQEHTSRYYVDRIKGFVETNAWQQAKHEIDLGLSDYPDDPDLRYYNGRYYYVAKNLHDARYNLVRAIQSSDQHFKAKRLMVDVEDDLHHYSSAICYINELLEFQPYDRDLWRRKIALYRKLGNTVEADAALERLAHIYPNDTVIRRELRNHHRAQWRTALQKGKLAEAADELEQWIDDDPGERDYYVQLTSIYERMGEYERALGTVNRGLSRFPHDQALVQKGLGIMTGMGLYAQALTFARQHGSDTRLYAGLLQEVADDARLKDPYEANGRLYALTHSADALTYLINTSLTRGYHDDARYYLQEAMRGAGRTKALLTKLYALEKQCGDDAAATRLLAEIYQKDPKDDEIADAYADRLITMATREMEGQAWHEADTLLARALHIINPAREAWPSTVARRIAVLGHLGRYDDARRLTLSAQQSDAPNAQRYASAYEDIAARRIRQFIEDEHYEAALHEAEQLLAVVPRSEVALRSCINMAQTLRRDSLYYHYAGRGFEAFPEQPYFRVKQALALHSQGMHIEALQLVNPRQSDDEWMQPQYVAATSGISHEWVEELLKAHMPSLAMEVVTDALACDSLNRELLFDKGMVHEALKEFDMAYYYQSRYYEPGNAELQAYREHINYLGFRSFKNRVDASYTSAYYDTKSEGLASVGHLYSIATVTYSRLSQHNTYTGQVSYKGIDGYHIDGTDEETGAPTDKGVAGGAGLELMGQWEHDFGRRWSATLSASWSTRYFNKFGANLSAAYAADHGWTPSVRIGYRRTPETYIYLGGESAETMREGKYNLFLVSPSVEKSWERIKTTLSADLTAMEKSIYYNIGLKAKLFFNDDNISSVAIITGFGSFPELSFFEQTALRNLSHTNTMVGFDAQYLCTRHLYIGLSGSWNTCYNPYRLADGSLTDSYRNIYSITAQLHVAF